MLFLTCCLIGFGLWYYKPILVKLKKFHQVAENFQIRNPSEMWLVSYAKSFQLVIRCYLFDMYHSMTSIHTKKFTFIKYIQGGNICVSIIPNKSGPKKNLEYGYIDGKRMDDLILMLAGQLRDFSGHNESLLEFGNTIRYKFESEPEVILYHREGSENKKIQENYKKIKKLVWIS
jgi:hypothetical protein